MPINSTTSPDALAEWEELARLARLMAPIWESYDANNPYHTQLMLAWRQACAPERIARLVAAAQRGIEAVKAEVGHCSLNSELHPRTCGCIDWRADAAASRLTPPPLSRVPLRGALAGPGSRRSRGADPTEGT